MRKNTTQVRKHFFGPPEMLKTLDMFGAPLPAFNVRGENAIRTHCGGCVSLLIMYVTFIFATLKIQHLLSRHNPSVNNFVERNVFDHTDDYSPREKDFKLAIRVEDYVTGEMKNEPNMVKWTAYYVAVADGK